MADNHTKISYDELCYAQRTPYLQWLQEQEQMAADDAMNMTEQGKRVKLLPFLSCEESIVTCLQASGESLETDREKSQILWLFTYIKGQLSEQAQGIFAKYCKAEQADILYADEDYISDAASCRSNPWFKPDFSPDTLSSFFYYGSVFAIEAGYARRVWQQFLQETESENDGDVSIYEFFLYASGQTTRICHIPRVLFTNGSLAEKDKLPGFRMDWQMIEKTTWWKHYYKQTIPELTRVSVIVPSKDNRSILFRCLSTMLEKTKYPHYEIIIVDNGSSGENRMWITKDIADLQTKYGKSIQYLYHKQNFNFSAMCNQGAVAATGEYLLFLNDDMEIMQGEWLSEMLSQAVQTHVGAVGAKLLYPRAQGAEFDAPYRIQHVGITNMGIGPAHKLAGMEDVGSLYHGHNLATYNMIAVTAACLMVKRSKFDEVHGFDESLAVAYNDVELCFKLYEAGYLNVVRNDAVLLHHESLSRGQDDTPERKKRLAKEKSLLYQKHSNLLAKDPFYSQNLVQWKKEVEYHCNFLYPCDRKIHMQRCSDAERKKMPQTHTNRWMRRLTGENLSMLQIDGVEQDETELMIHGWYVLREHDNGVLDKTLLLWHKESDTVYKAALYPKLREDVEALFQEEEKTKRTALAGIYALVDSTELPKGRYAVGILARSRKNGEYYGKGRIQYAGEEYILS